MRLAGTSVVCVLAAFGAAFLVARASGHQSSAQRAASASARAGTHRSAAVAHRPSRVDVELASQFAPQFTALVRPPRRHHRATHHRASAPAPAASAGSSQSAAPSPTPQTAAPPTYGAPSTPVQPVTQAPSGGSGASSGSSSTGGSSHPRHGHGTTTIG